MKKGLFFSVLSTFVLLTACGGQNTATTAAGKTEGATNAPSANSNSTEKIVKIGITQIVEHPSLDQGRKGFIAALNDAGYKEGKNLKLDVQFAQGDMNNNISIAQKFVGDKDDLILAISTPSAQAAVKASNGNVPVVFTAITDPVGAKLVSNMEKPGGNVTGMCDTHPDVSKTVAQTIKRFFPNAKKVGILYNSGEQNSATNVKDAKAAMQAVGLETVDATAARSSEVQAAAESLVGRVDAIAYFKDNTIASALESVIKVANQNHLPFFAGDIDSVKRGVFAGCGVEEYDLGYSAGKKAVEILKGKKPGDISVGLPDKVQTYMNEKAVSAIGVKLTDELKKGIVFVK